MFILKLLLALAAIHIIWTISIISSVFLFENKMSDYTIAILVALALAPIHITASIAQEQYRNAKEKILTRKIRND